MKFGTYSFLNKFAAKSCKRFAPHLNNISTLPCDTWNAHRRRAITSTVTSKYRQIWIHLITEFKEYCERRRTKHVSLIWTYRRRHWRMAVAMTTWFSLVHPVLSRCFGWFRSLMSILNTFCYNPHSVIKYMQICQICKPRVKWNKFWSFFSPGGELY